MAVPAVDPARKLISAMPFLLITVGLPLNAAGPATVNFTGTPERGSRLAAARIGDHGAHQGVIGCSRRQCPLLRGDDDFWKRQANPITGVLPVAALSQ